ncbi:proline racemase family protein [Haloferula sp.]|uniref:proline racemase family protein n=1 Tax=Haloferula sp. TaxID=2497595 RepID=UPI003C741DE8
MQRVRVIDSHTAGEPTRVVISGGPEVPSRGASAARDYLRTHADWMRRALIHEPRGFEAVVGAFLCKPADESCVSGVVFFNNADYLNGCIHGTIGVIETLAHLGRIQAGTHRLETPVGVVSAKLDEDGEVTVENVPSYRHAHQVTLEVPDYGTVCGDVAWGGNWFFLIFDQGPALKRTHIEELTNFTWAVRQALENSGISGKNGGLIDHVEVFSDPEEGVEADSQNFVLCPGKAYDRSPCGTGTSAKLACLAAEGSLAEGETIRQAGILGTAFTGRYRRIDETTIIPIVQGRAYITAECEMILRPDDPYRYGVESFEKTS